MRYDRYGEPRPQARGYLLYIILTMAISAALLFFSRQVQGFGEWYARRVFPLFPLSLGRLSGLAPFSLFEFVLLGLAVSLPLAGLWKIVSAARRRRQWREDDRPSGAPGRRILRFFCVVCSLFLLFVLTCGVNYNRDTFAQQAGYPVQDELSAGELRQLYRLLVGQIGELEQEGFRSVTGDIATDHTALNKAAVRSMEDLSLSYPGLIGYYPEAKPVYFSEVLSRCQLGGFYSCFTMEANYNRFMPQVGLPFTVCHELAHMSGFAREDEANFIGYLACSRSEDPAFRYSGVFYALGYTLSALGRSIETEEYLTLCEYLPEWVWRDIYDNRQYWQAFEGKTSEIYQTANDSFLKVNNQQDGMQSYGRMLYLLLAYYRDNARLEHYSPNPEPVLAELSAINETLYCANAVLADRETGIILYAKDSGVRAEPASVTKILTAVTALEMIEDMDATVTMKTQDYTDLYRLGASLSGFRVGESVSYRDLLYTLMMISGCDSAYALANNLCGSLPAFADKMNQRVAALGLSDSHFVDPSGLTAPEHYTTAEDMVRILDYALQNAAFREIFEAGSYTIPPTNLTAEEREIHNSFFSRLERDFAGVDQENGLHVLGGKTGFTNAAGLCLATIGEFDGREYIAVLFGGPGNNRTPQYNFMDAMTLFGALRSRTFNLQMF